LWRDAVRLLEKFAEMPRRFEPRAAGDFFDTQPRGLQEMQTVAKPFPPEIFYPKSHS